MEKEYDKKINNKDESLYSIKISENEMWIKNHIDKNNLIHNIENINLRNMVAWY